MRLVSSIFISLLATSTVAQDLSGVATRPSPEDIVLISQCSVAARIVSRAATKHPDSENARDKFIANALRAIDSPNLPPELSPTERQIFVAKVFMETIVQSSPKASIAQIRNERILSQSAAACALQAKL